MYIDQAKEKEKKIEMNNEKRKVKKKKILLNKLDKFRRNKSMINK